MNIAFTLYKYTPYGGMQRDFMRIARECVRRGHSVKAYVMNWNYQRPEDMQINIAPSSSYWRTRARRDYANWVEQCLKREKVDCVVGFNHLPKPDIYYAADGCYQDRLERYRHPWYKYTPRAKYFLRNEHNICTDKTRLLCLTHRCKNAFEKYYQTPSKQISLLPPAINYPPIKDTDHKTRCKAAREEIKRELQNQDIIGNDTTLLITMGSNPRTKGFDRTLKAIYTATKYCKKNHLALPQLLVIGDNPSSRYRAQIKYLGIDKQVHFLAGRDNISGILLAADIMVHPARWEVAGMILLEAMVHGLAVLTSQVCGYAHHVSDANAGIVLESPFSQQQLDQALITLCMNTKEVKQYRQRALRYAQNQKWEPQSATRLAVDCIEQAT